MAPFDVDYALVHLQKLGIVLLLRVRVHMGWIKICRYELCEWNEVHFSVTTISYIEMRL